MKINFLKVFSCSGQLPQHPQSILLNSLTASSSPASPQKSLLSPRSLTEDKFELTDDYIQQTIKSALNR